MRCIHTHAIARMEGFYASNSAPDRPQREDNPGDIEYGPFTIAHGATGTDGRFAIFPDADTGMECLRSLLASPAYANLTIQQAVNRYAPPNENDTVNYVDMVCKWTGFQPTNIVGASLDAPTQ